MTGAALSAADRGYWSTSLPKITDRNRDILTLVRAAMDDESDEKLVEKVAREVLDHHGPNAIPILRERAEAADMTGDQLAADTWREIADAAERIVRDNRRVPPLSRV